MKRVVLTCTAIIFAASNCYAACAKKTVFSCTTTKGKQIEICDTGDSLEYAFGKAGKPDKTVKIAKNKIEIHPMSGGYGCGTIDFPSGTTSYSVFSCVEKQSGAWSGGVTVSTNGKRAAEINCNESKTVVDNMGNQ